MSTTTTTPPEAARRARLRAPQRRHARGDGPGQSDRDRQDRERGSVALVMPILAVALLSMAGLVIDGGAALSARGRAADVAQQAARAGADALSPASLRRAGPDSLVINPAAAQAAAQQILSVGDVDGQVSVSGDTVTVTAAVTRTTALLSAVGITTVTGRATADATVLYGGTTEHG